MRLVCTLVVLLYAAYQCHGVAYLKENPGRIITLPICDMNDCFMEGWCKRHVCPAQKPKPLTSCPGYCRAGAAHVFAADPFWSMPPARARDKDGKVWFNCNCPCCDVCSVPQSRGVSSLMRLLMQRRGIS